MADIWNGEEFVMKHIGSGYCISRKGQSEHTDSRSWNIKCPNRMVQLPRWLLWLFHGIFTMWRFTQSDGMIEANPVCRKVHMRLIYGALWLDDKKNLNEKFPMGIGIFLSGPEVLISGEVELDFLQLTVTLRRVWTCDRVIAFLRWSPWMPNGWNKLNLWIELLWGLNWIPSAWALECFEWEFGNSAIPMAS